MTTFLIAGDEGDQDLTAVVRALEQNAFGVIGLSPDPATGGRIMRLSKLKYAVTDDLRAHYRILNGRGLINYQGEGERVTDVTQPWADSPGKRILIIGSNPETIGNVREALGEGYEVIAEPDLKRGVERARAEKPGLVIVTPVRSMEAVRAITELARDSESSIAFLSPSSNRSLDRVLYLRAGADDFLTEPFSPGEFRARVDALIRRSGRRLTQRDVLIPVISEDELHSFGANLPPLERGPREAILLNDDAVDLREDLKDRLQRNIDTVSKFDVPFALYWIKSDQKDAELNRALARLCRQEDILCYNAEGEFIALLTGADEQGVRGFQSRLDEKLGPFLREGKVRRGFRMCRPGERVDHL